MLLDIVHNELLCNDPDSPEFDTPLAPLTYTRFVPAPRPVSGVKKWIAHSGGFAKGELHLNAQAAAILLSDKAASILPVGITEVVGDFEKDDIVRIIAPDGKAIAVGKANCDAAQARAGMGHHGEKPVVHYDYLYIE